MQDTKDRINITEISRGLGAKKAGLLLPLDREAMAGLTVQIAGDSAA
jgi:hypothetical protein